MFAPKETSTLNKKATNKGKCISLIKSLYVYILSLFFVIPRIILIIPSYG